MKKTLHVRVLFIQLMALQLIAGAAAASSAQTLSADLSVISSILSKNNKTGQVLDACDTAQGRVVSFFSSGMSMLPASVESLTALKSLSLTNGTISALPEELSRLTSLVSLDVNFNKLSRLPADFGDLSNLTVLTISGNPIQRLPESFKNLRSLRGLNAQYCFSDSGFPEQLLSLDGLRSLKIALNRSESVMGPEDSIPYAISRLTSLDTLVLGPVYPMGFPKAICGLPQLKFLDIQFIQGAIPDEIGNVTSLEYLNLTGSKNLRVPSSASRLTNLKTLNVQLCGLKDMETMSSFPVRKLQCGVNDFPIIRLSSGSPLANSIEFLDVATFDNSGTVLPDSIDPSIGRLSKLRVLHIYNSSIRSIPEGLCDAVSLETLRVDVSPVMSLPDNIGNLSNLRYLGFTASRLASLPSSIGNLRNLASLSIARDRRLDSLPDEVYRLPNLKTLYLGGYYIREMDVAYAFCKLSPLIKNLTRLRTLSLERCSLRNLPKEILQLDSLTINVDLNYLNRAALDPAIVMWLDKHTLKDESGGTWDKRQRKDPLEKAINVVRNNSRNARMLVTGNGRVFLPPCSRGYGTFDVYSPDGRHVFSTSITGRSGRTIQLPDLAPLLYIGVLSTDNYVVQKAVLMK